MYPTQWIEALRDDVRFGGVARQLLTESLVLSALGGALGIGIGAAILAVAPSMIPPELLPAAVTLSFDLRVVGFCAAAAVLVGLLFGLARVWRTSQLTATPAITSDTRSTTAGGGRLREALVVAEVATAVVLVFGAALGATHRDVARLVVAGAARVIVTGAVIGLLVSTAAGRLLASMLFGVEALDPATFPTQKEESHYA